MIFQRARSARSPLPPAPEGPSMGFEIWPLPPRIFTGCHTIAASNKKRHAKRAEDCRALVGEMQARSELRPGAGGIL